MSTFQSLAAETNPGVFTRRIALDRLAKRLDPSLAIRLLATWGERAQMRGQLARLDDRQLRDIGVSPIDIQREIIKPFWRE